MVSKVGLGFSTENQCLCNLSLKCMQMYNESRYSGAWVTYRVATAVPFGASFWENEPQYCILNLEEKLKCLEGIIMGKSENLPAFCDQKGQRWEGGSRGDNLLLCSQCEYRRLRMSAVFDERKCFQGRKDDHLAKQPPRPFPAPVA